MRKRALAYALAFVTLVFGACTIFDDVTVRTVGDAGLDREGGADAQADSGQPAGFLSLEDAARFCTNVIKCPYLGTSTIQSIDVPVDGLNYSSCINWIAGPIPPDRVGLAKAAAALQCAANAASCIQAGACMWDEVIAANDPRCQSSDGGRTCAEDGGAVYDCAGGFILHCTGAYYVAGSTCMQGTDNVPWCGLGKNCTIATQCKGVSELDFCGSSTNLTNGIDCAVSGLTCGLDTASSQYACLTNGVLKTCSGAKVTCSGTSVDLCDTANDSLFNCGAFAGTCDPTALPRCTRPSDTCTPIDPGVNQCTGDVVSLCVGGQPTSLDCTNIGMKCVPGTGGASPHCG